ncbi:UNKNOWN [Stylonychia lemnae]|uniref:Morn repeat protein n=1 Tax=Stylonychia lemnae TaxID=5949 RepID=A0A078AIB4_STYLE|nr:UNKNOWN [Stylonychia lemnae]|eukprot:CDW81949.1 UNKNOWN [Stylonychia lemnae]
METELSLEQQQALKYFTFIGDPTSSLKCLIHQNQCKHYCKGCHAPICSKCILNHQNSTPSRKDKDLSSNLSHHRITEIEQYAKETLEQYTQVFLDIEDYRFNKRDELMKKESMFKRELKSIMLKMHKFVTHMMMHVQEEIVESIDKDYSKWDKQRQEFTQLLDSQNFNELFLRRKEMQITKRDMRSYLKNLQNNNSFTSYDQIKSDICLRMRNMMSMFQNVMDFAMRDEYKSQFDSLVAENRINELLAKAAQRKYLLGQDKLKEKLSKLKDNLNLVLKEIDSIGLSNDYNILLDENQNPDIKTAFERIDRVKGAYDSYVYFGQIHQGQMHGLGTMLFKNGFCYQGMFVKGSRDGLGFTYDLSGNKYKGEHRKGIREGQGIFKTNDDKLYEGGWSNNKMHGRGRETFTNGECFIVYYKNGYKLEALASKMHNTISNISQNDTMKIRNESSNFGKLKQSYLNKTQRDRDASSNRILSTQKSVRATELLKTNLELDTKSQKTNKKEKVKKPKKKDDGDCKIF